MRNKACIALAIFSLLCCCAWGSAERGNRHLQQECKELSAEVSQQKDIITTLEIDLSTTKTDLEMASLSLDDANSQLDVIRDEMGEVPQGIKFSHLGNFEANVNSSGEITLLSDSTENLKFDTIPDGSYVYIEGIGMEAIQDVSKDIRSHTLAIYINAYDKSIKKNVQNTDVWLITEGDVCYN